MTGAQLQLGTRFTAGSWSRVKYFSKAESGQTTCYRAWDLTASSAVGSLQKQINNGNSSPAP